MNSKVRHDLILNDLSVIHNLPLNEIKEIINSPFIFIRNEIKEIDFTKITKEEELKNLKTNFNIPRIGKLYANFYNIKRINNVRRNKR